MISNQRPNSTAEFQTSRISRKETLHIDDAGVYACRVAEQKEREIDWTERERELRDLCDKFRRTDGEYDCIVPDLGKG